VAARLDAEIAGFLAWLERGPEIDPVLKAGVAHLWFVTLHPFDDGNGRIARAVLNRLLDGFEGKLTTTKWAKLMKSSQDTATRDIQDLIERGVLVRSSEGGRSTSYALVLAKPSTS
jgi:Fic family protein